ncbi:unnamed protein product [Schistosoma spindalis]|nr:unnamed protein product [Schistosoma spindale]
MLFRITLPITDMSRTSESHELNSCSTNSKEGYFSDIILQDASTMNDFVQSEGISHSLAIDNTAESNEDVLDEKNEVPKAKDAFPRGDYEFLGLLEQQMINKK